MGSYDSTGLTRRSSWALEFPSPRLQPAIAFVAPPSEPQFGERAQGCIVLSGDDTHHPLETGFLVVTAKGVQKSNRNQVAAASI